MVLTFENVTNNLFKKKLFFKPFPAKTSRHGRAMTVDSALQVSILAANPASTACETPKSPCAICNTVIFAYPTLSNTSEIRTNAAAIAPIAPAPSSIRSRKKCHVTEAKRNKAIDPRHRVIQPTIVGLRP